MSAGRFLPLTKARHRPAGSHEGMVAPQPKFPAPPSSPRPQRLSPGLFPGECVDRGREGRGEVPPGSGIASTTHAA